MNVTEFILVLFLAWQIASMPISAWFATAFFGVDAEAYHDSSDFSENKFGHIQSYWGVLLFVLELVKVVLAMSLVNYLNPVISLSGVAIPMEYVLSVVVLLGHMFPIYGEFKSSNSLGGILGLILFLWTVPGLFALGFFVLLWVLRKNVSITSVVYTLGINVIITFILIDLYAGITALTLSSLLVLSVLNKKLVAEKV